MGFWFPYQCWEARRFPILGKASDCAKSSVFLGNWDKARVLDSQFKKVSSQADWTPEVQHSIRRSKAMIFFCRAALPVAKVVEA